MSLLAVERGELPSHSLTQVQGCPVGVHMQACVYISVVLVSVCTFSISYSYLCF